MRSVALLALALSGCGSAAAVPPGPDGGTVGDAKVRADVEAGSTAKVTVTVDHGYGGGSYTVGSTIHVWSDVNPQTGLTTGWSGAPGVPTEWNGEFVVPNHDVTLSPTIATAPVTRVTRSYALAAGPRTVLGVFPSKPKGLVLFFHGAEFTIDQLEDNAASTITIALVHAGYVVVALPSEAETAGGIGGWNPALTGNPDLDNVVLLVKALRADGTVPSSAKVVSWGMSSGGIFSHTVGAKLPADVVTAYCGPGIAEAITATHARTAWYLAAHDTRIPTSVPDSQAFQKQLEGRGIKTDLYVHPSTPLYDQRFTRVAGVDAQRSAKIAVSLRAHEDVDAANGWLVTGTSITDSLMLDGLSGLSAAQTAAVAEEIDIMAADHELYDDVANRMVSFIEAP